MRFITILCCFLIASVAVAKDFKIATVDVSKIVKQYPGYISAQKQLSAVKDKKQSELIEEKKDLDDLGQEIKKSESVMSKKELNEKKYLYSKKQQDLMDHQSQAENDLAAQQTQMLTKIVDEVKAIVNKTAQEKGVDLVLDSQSALYAKDAIDLTDDILKKYKVMDSDSKDDTNSKK
jgi:outer membrane protein